MTEFIVVTGMSGGGRSQAADNLEDLGWYVIDNLPPALIPKLVDLAEAPESTSQRVALVVGTGPYHQDVMPASDELRRSGATVRILYLDADTDVLVRRYESSRRRHPLSDLHSLTEAIQTERQILQPVRAEADVVVDTTDLNVHQLRERILDLFGSERPDAGMQTTVLSFGYRHGLPLDVDMVVDCRFLPNPYWVEDLRPLTGLDEPVRKYVLEQPVTAAFLERLDGLLELLVPAYVDEGKAYLTIALGCTGGRHRSVVIAEEVARALRERGHEPSVAHRDRER